MKAKTKQPSQRYSRKGTPSSFKRLPQCHAVVVGAGAMGRAVAVLLASLGVRHMSLYDPAFVTNKDLRVGFMDFDIGEAKVDAVANSAHQQNPHMELQSYRSQFHLSHSQQWRPGWKNAVFLCGGTQALRKATWGWVKQSAQFICEATKGVHEIKLLTWTKQLHQPCETELATNNPDKSSNDLVMANLSACLMVYQFIRWLQNCPVRNDQSFQLC